MGDITTPDQSRVLIIGHRHHMAMRARGFYDALASAFDLKVHFVEDKWPARFGDIASGSDFDACIWFVQFRDLLKREGFDWDGFQGARLMYDWDTFQNYYDILLNPFRGIWPGMFNRNRFDLILCTGREISDRLKNEGVPAHWLPKAYDPGRLQDLKGKRSGLCYFGSIYPARRMMLRYLSRHHIEYSMFHCQDDALNTHLNRYLGCIICNMAAPSRIRSRYLQRFLPEIACSLGPGVEPMLKNFEVPGAGCAPITDFLPEFEALGFRDGETMVSYSSFDELHEKLLYYQANPEGLLAIGKKANALVQANHTWLHRAHKIKAVLDNRSEMNRN